MKSLVLFNKPYNVISQFSGASPRETLSHYLRMPGVYPAGRLDKDSEGLLLLTNDGSLQHRIAHPRFKLPKTYWVQVEGEVYEDALESLRQGVILNDGPTKPALVRAIQPPVLWDRHPPIRFRAQIPTQWLEITIKEGRNRQIRRMTAAVGHPTLRLIRVAIGDWSLGTLKPGEFQVTSTS